MAGLSGMLVAVLVMSALLGCLIGVAGCLLVTRRHTLDLERAVDADVDRSLREAESRVARSDEHLASERERFAAELSAAKLAEQERFAAELTTARTAERERFAAELSTVKAAEREALSRYEALQVHSLVQARQIDSLVEEQRAAEERQIRLEKALRSQQQEIGLATRERGLTRDRQREPGLSEPDATDRDGDPSIDESTVPVLNRRAAPVQPVASTPRRSHLSSGRLARGSGGRAGGVVALTLPIDEGDFPVLSEAELPDDVDGLELDVIDVEGRG